MSETLRGNIQTWGEDERIHFTIELVTGTRLKVDGPSMTDKDDALVWFDDASVMHIVPFEHIVHAWLGGLSEEGQQAT